MEQEEYTKEEINWSYVEFVDNQDVLDLIERVSADLARDSGYQSKSVALHSIIFDFTCRNQEE